MKKGRRVFEILYWRGYFLLQKLSAQKTPVHEPPLRAEIFSRAQMEDHARSLAARHRISTDKAQDRLLARLAENEKIIASACLLISTAFKSKMQTVPAAEWLLDNYYLIEEQIGMAKRHLPRDYSRGLPRLYLGDGAGPPRIYDIAMEIISHGDGRIDPEILSLFISVYQETAPLRLGELWALPIMLRLALIENLRRISDRLASNRLSRNLSGLWADRMIEMAEKDPSSLILVVADMARSAVDMDGTFVAELARLLQGQGSAMALPLSWIEQRLAQSFQTIEQVIQTEVQQQATDQVSVSNSIGSLRLLRSINWRDFVESLSVVEKTLQRDPAQVYSLMDFATRDRYRHSVEEIAKQSPHTEEEVAALALKLAQDAAGDAPRERHVGYYLVDRGRARLEQAAQVRLPFLKKLARGAELHPLRLYLAGVALLTGGFTYALAACAHRSGVPDALLAATTLLTLAGASQLGVALVNWLVTVLAEPRLVPRLDFSSGIPADARTLVAVPTLISRFSGVDQLCEALEVRFLANRDPNLYFCLLTDFADAPAEHLPEDAALLDYAEAKVRALNGKYAEGEDVFFLLHRPRRWNPAEGVWMAHERKRGKLGALNAFLLTGDRAPFSRIAGKTEALRGIKYVITLDTDTQLPRDSARQLVAAMAHVLNHPLYDEKAGRVTAGYGLIQPRVAPSLPGAHVSLYAQFYSGETGIDPYTRAVSDVYQDLFREGSFIGKGIYDVAVFERALKDRLPDNRILSHDLLEGCYIRSALLSDVQLYEEYPPRYAADVSRRHRWIRGDWQVASWALPRAPDAGSKGRNPLSALSRWKIFDNLRRSLVPPALLLLLLVAWARLPAPGLWTAAVAGVFLISPLCSRLFDLVRKSKDFTFRQKLGSALRGVSRHCVQAAFELAVLPYEAFYHADAIARVLWRLAVSRKNLLEWTPSNESARASRLSLPGTYRRMWFAPLLAAGCTAFLLAARPEALGLNLLLLPLWILSPGLAWWVSRPLGKKSPALDASQLNFLNMLARRTWAFFETYVGPADNWLPPDNMQEQPVSAVAHRTSPTNMGMALLANLAAWDFGYITAARCVAVSAETLKTMAQLQRYRGHFYNWYDTLTLKPLHPLYISSVDSGNLAGHLLTLRQGLLAMVHAPVVRETLFSGLSATLGLVMETAGEQWPDAVYALKEKLSLPPPAGLAATLARLRELTALAEEAAQQPGRKGAVFWREKLSAQCRAALDDLAGLAPWAAVPVPDSLQEKAARLDAIPSLQDIADYQSRLLPEAGDETERAWADSLLRLMAPAAETAAERIRAIEALALQCTDMAEADYDFLYNPATHLLSIGYNVDGQRRDASAYDLLASEARLGYFVAIAQRKLPQESWFALGRQLVDVGGKAALLSWSGSMFEYLMPLLVMPTFDHTLLDQTCIAMVKRQIEYGGQRGVPWGVSESGYNMFDSALNYQYRAFGVPGLGLKRDLASDLVVAPYASVMALMVSPEDACRNLQRLAAAGFMGTFGFYEAIDYTATRLPRGKNHALIQSFMAHHQGMSFLSLAYLLLDRPMQARFEADPLLAATAQLLHEKAVRAVAGNFVPRGAIETAENGNAPPPAAPVRLLTTAATRAPEVQLLSNGRYHVMVTNAGGSYSRWRDLAVTRWREDGTRDNYGMFCYIRDRADGAFWSTAWQPVRKPAKNYEVIFSESRAEFRRRDGDIETYTEIVVSPEDDIEIRRTRITNRGRQKKNLDITSYAEVVLAPPAAEAAHPAFSNLFVQTEILPGTEAILCTRRPRSMQEKPPTMFHMMVVRGPGGGPASFETDRMKFIGRGRTAAAPQALLDPAPLSGSEGPVLDPIAAIRRTLTLQPDQSIVVDIVTGAAETRTGCLALIARYHDLPLADRVFELSWTHNQALLRQMNATDADAQLYGRLAGAILYASTALRADAGTLSKNRRGQSGLWSYAISGDLPIVLLKIRDIARIELARQLVQAHAYWRLKGLVVDLVIWNEDQASYRQILQEEILGLIAAGTEAHTIDRPGGIFVRAIDQIPAADRILIESVARLVIDDSNGRLEEQIKRPSKEAQVPLLMPKHSPYAATSSPNILSLPSSLLFFNGTGGFTPDGREYMILTGPKQRTPLPWSNVLANPGFGTVISESGQSYTWGENAHEFRLTPWHNDPVTDAAGEAFYLRDESSGAVWSPAALPVPARAPYIVRHGFGYSAFEHEQNGIWSELRVFVAADASIKFSVLKVRNLSPRPRRLSATGYVEWVLGDMKSKTGLHIGTGVDPATGALVAHNYYNTEFEGRTAFFDTDGDGHTFTCDRREFIGRNGSLQAPEALGRLHLSGRTGHGLDPCAAIQVPFDLEPGEEREIVFRLGVTRHGEDTAAFIRRFRGPAAAAAALEAVHAHWREALGAVRVETPDPAVNVLANGWLLYQTIACRLWARSGYYQSGGAFGFRDQLQDVMALVHTKPQLLREHLLLCARHQFVEGDVQHWWHPPSDRGVRTKCSDDYLWLPLAAARYVEATGDMAVLDEVLPFIEGRPLSQGEDSYYDMPLRSADAADLYQHCVRALLHGLRFGARGLPLIGSCDWNDGMDKVGEHGAGESVWLAFFLYDVLLRFAVVSDRRDDADFAALCRTEAEKLRLNIDANGWDGAWYRRAYFDDGTPLGSAANDECQIDSLSQSWAVLSKAGDPEKTRQGMDAACRRLVRAKDGLVQLLDPPFDKSALNPGYIRGYVPGVRENGGQYTHAAIWLAMAAAQTGDAARAWEILGIINPLNHGRTAQEVALYRAEPYVVAADVYGVAPHTGRGGWTWYTGSSGWMYRLILESLLGLHRAGDTLAFAPCLPPSWPGFSMTYRNGGTVYEIEVKTGGAPGISVDGAELPGKTIPLADDGGVHKVVVRTGTE